MGILDAMFGIADFLIDIWHGIRFGFTSMAWGWLGGICLIGAIVCFTLSWPIPGVVCAAGCIACDIKEWRCQSREMQEYQEKSRKKVLNNRNWSVI